MPPQYSDQIIDYLIIDFDKNIFDYTSGVEDQLELTGEIFKKFMEIHVLKKDYQY